jgi:hypothetical protein
MSNAIILLSYRRPELTEQALRGLMKTNPGYPILVSIDGLRSDADPQEREWRAATIRIAEKIAEQSGFVDVKIRDKNEGLTRHVSAAIEQQLEQAENLILLEEDMEIGPQGLDFLRANVEEGKEARIAAAYTSYNHLQEITDDPRLTFFPQQWGISLNRKFFELFMQVLYLKEIEPSQISSSVKRSLASESGRTSHHVSNYWSNLFTSALRHPSHTDALLQATAMMAGIPYRTSWISLVNDLGRKDPRGMSPRSGAVEQRSSHELSYQNGFCRVCERKLSRKSVAVPPYLWYEKMYGNLRKISIRAFD